MCILLLEVNSWKQRQNIHDSLVSLDSLRLLLVTKITIDAERLA